MKWAYFGHTPNMPINDEHFSYTNIFVGMEFLLVMPFCLKNYLLIKAQVSPFFLLVDESTNETLEQHLVMYACL
jgi:hypothetical protein